MQLAIKRTILTVCSILIILVVAHSQVTNFDIEYPYSDYVEKLYIEEHSGYFYCITKEDVLLLNGNEWMPLEIKKHIGIKKARLNPGIIVNNTFLFVLERELVSIDFRTKELKEVWSTPENHNIWKIHHDKIENTIWVFTQDKNSHIISVFSKDEDGLVQHKYDLPDFGVKSIFQARFFFEASDDLFYFYGQYNSIFVFDKEGNEIEYGKEGTEKDWKTCYVFRLDNKKRLWRIKGTQYERYNSATNSFELHPISGQLSTKVDCVEGTFNGRRLMTLYEDRKGRIWLGFEDSHLFYYDLKEDKFILIRQELVDELKGGNGNIKSFQEDGHGNYWGNKRGGLFKIREKEKYFESYLVNTDDKDHPIYENGKNPFINKVVAFFKESGIRRSSIRPIYEDVNSDLYFQGSQFTFRLPKGSSEVEVIPFFEEKSNLSLYIDKDIKLLSIWDAYFTFDSNLKFQKKLANLKEIKDIFRTRNGNLYITGRIDDKGKRLFAKLNPKTFEFEGNMIDPKGEIDFDYHRMYSVDEDEQENLIMGSNAGLLKFNIQEGFKEVYSNPFIYKENEIRLSFHGFKAYYIGQDYVWLKTENEIALLNMNSKEIEYLLHKSDIEIAQFYSILPVDKESVWVGDSEGFFYYNFTSNKLVRYHEKEGLGEGTYVKNIVKLKDGRLALGSANGLYIAHPDSLIAKKNKIAKIEDEYAIKLSSFSYLDGKTEESIRNDFVMDYPQDIHLNYNDKILKLEYFINNQNNLNRQTYSYKLEGFDKDWSQRSKSNVANYASLPPGKYTFKARGAASGDNWSEKQLIIPIIVHQAWFKTNWFYGLIMLGIGLLIFWIVSSYFKSRLKKRAQIEQLRSKISSDLHDDVGSLLSSLAWQTDMISMTANEKTKQKFKKISGLSRQAMERMRDTVWAIDASKDDTQSLIDRMTDFLADHFENRTMAFQFEHDNFTRKITLNPDVRQNVYLIFKEAVVNALKHSNGDLLKINLQKVGQKLVLEINDNGEINEDAIKKSGLGLKNMKLRANRINAEIQQTWNDGCKIKLII